MATHGMYWKSVSVFASILLFILFGTFIIFCPTESYAQEGKTYQVVIIKGAGYLPGAEKPTEPDAITQATSVPGNTHVFCDSLVQKFSVQKVETQVFDFSECGGLTCLDQADIVIFAGPSYYRKLPEQLENLFPVLTEDVKRRPQIICSSLILANYTWRGIVTMQHVDEELKKTGVKTVPGVVFNSDVIQKELDEDLKDFIVALIEKAEEAGK